MIVALIALVVALSGTAVAASGLINGAKIKNGTIAGKKLKKHTLTGAQINLAKLGKVPSATTADSATTAANATHATAADSATTATNATNAANAANAANADKLGGTSAGGYIHGGGSEFSAGLTIANNAAFQNVVNVPGVGTMTATCPGGLSNVQLVNNTGATVDEQYALFQDTTVPIVQGVTVTNTNPVVNMSGAGRVQSHVMLAWPDGAPTHFVDMTIGYYEQTIPSIACVIQVHGSAS
jgi:hypothetical protein